MQEPKTHSYLKGAAILTAASIFVKIIGVIYKIPLFNIIDDAGLGAFQTSYNVYALFLAIATAGVPAAMSRLVSSARATGNEKLAQRCFRVAMPAFIIIGVIAMLIMFFFAESLAELLNNSLAAPGIRVLAPAALFVCIISVYRGYAQGHQNMMPTAVSQVIEVVSKLLFGIAFALWFTYLGYASNVVSAAAIAGVTIGLGLCIPALIWYNRKINRQFAAMAKENSSSLDAPGAAGVLTSIFKVTLPISLSASFMSIMVLIDNAIVLGRLQSVLEFSEYEAVSLMGLQTYGNSIYNITPALLVPISVSVIPAIASAVAKKNYFDAGEIVQSSVKLVSLIAMPAAAGIIVLSHPILISLYNTDVQLATDILIILGLATFFVCMQFLTTSILQAYGHERISLLTFPIGAAIKITISYTLAGNPQFGILASSIGTLACFAIIATLNILFIKMRLPEKPKFLTAFLKPFICSFIMAIVALISYSMIFYFGSRIFGSERFAIAAYLVISIIISVVIYGILVIVLRAVTKEDMKLVPKGDKIVRFLKLR